MSFSGLPTAIPLSHNNLVRVHSVISLILHVGKLMHLCKPAPLPVSSPGSDAGCPQVTELRTRVISDTLHCLSAPTSNQPPNLATNLLCELRLVTEPLWVLPVKQDNSPGL